MNNEAGKKTAVNNRLNLPEFCFGPGYLMENQLSFFFRVDNVMTFLEVDCVILREEVA